MFAWRGQRIDSILRALLLLLEKKTRISQHRHLPQNRKNSGKTISKAEEALWLMNKQNEPRHPKPHTITRKP
jgi:hypothetical protein